jgi:hypothetical protein
MVQIAGYTLHSNSLRRACEQLLLLDFIQAAIMPGAWFITCQYSKRTP